VSVDTNVSEGLPASISTALWHRVVM
jgi:hypothetical protein